MAQYVNIANLKGATGDEGPPGLGTHGTLSSPTNIGELRAPAQMGTYVIRAQNIIGGPPLVNQGNPLVTLLVTWGANNGVSQYVTTVNEAWFRSSPTGTTWGWWRKLSRENGILEEDTDLDEIRGRRWDGVTAIRTQYIINGPSGLPDDVVAVVEVSFGANNGTVQKISTGDQVWQRKSTSSTSWASWLRMDGATAATLISSATDIDQWYLQEHHGEYGVRADNLIGGPSVDGNPLGIFKVTWGGARNAVGQSFQTEDQLWWRNLRFFDTGTWGPWRQAISSDGSDAIDGVVTSTVVRRIVTSTDPDTPLSDGDLLLILEEED